MIFSQLEFMVALARERHFARAAQVCSVSQPALSEGIRKLEDELAVPLIRRANRFEGLTAEGEQVVMWARRIIADRDALTDKIGAMREGVAGSLRLGSIPTATAAASLLTVPFCARHPKALVHVLSDLRSDDVLRLLSDYEIDAGITYIDDGISDGVRVTPLYVESYVLLTSAAESPIRTEATWAEAAALPLCLLDKAMQGRRRFDEVFRAVGLQPEPRVETNSVASLFSQVAFGPWATIIPAAWLHVFGVPKGMRALRLVGPELQARIGLVTLGREPPSIMAEALVATARETDFTVLEKPAFRQR